MQGSRDEGSNAVPVCSNESLAATSARTWKDCKDLSKWDQLEVTLVKSETTQDVTGWRRRQTCASRGGGTLDTVTVRRKKYL